MATKIADLFVKIGADISEFLAKTEQIDSSWKKVGQQMVDVGNSMSMYITAPLTALGIASMNTFGQYEKAMNMVRGLTSATADDFSRLDETAKRLGATTQYSAVQAAEAMQFLGMAGFDTNQIIGAMPGTLQLAASAQMDMATAADIVTNILTGYNLKVEELARVNDVLVKAFTSANTNLQQLGEAMQYAGPVASSAGVAFEEATAALALMGNAGIQASMAGTSLRGAITRVLNPTKQVADAMKQAGLNFTDAEGRLLPLAEIIEQLGPHAEDTGLLMQIFGQRAGPAFAGLVTQGADALRELTAELVESEGAARRMAEVQVEGWTGAWIRLKSALEGVFISIGETLAPVLSTAADFITSLMTAFIELEQPTKNIIAFFAALAAAAGPFLVTLGSILKIIPLITPAIALLSGPVGLAVAAITALIGVGVTIYRNWEDFSAFIKNNFSGTLTSLSKLWETVKTAVGDAWNSISNAFKELGGALSDLGGSSALQFLGSRFADAFDFIVSVVTNALSVVVNTLSGAIGVIANLISTIVALLRGDFSGAWEYLKDAFQTLWGTIVRIFIDAVDTILATVNFLIGWLPGVEDGINKTRQSLANLAPMTVMEQDAKSAARAMEMLKERMEATEGATASLGIGLNTVNSHLAGTKDGVDEMAQGAGEYSLIVGQVSADSKKLSKEAKDAAAAAAVEAAQAAIKAAEEAQSAINKIFGDLENELKVFDREIKLGIRVDQTGASRLHTEIEAISKALEAAVKDVRININAPEIRQLQERLNDAKLALLDLQIAAGRAEVEVLFFDDAIKDANVSLKGMSDEIQKSMTKGRWADLMKQTADAMKDTSDAASDAEKNTRSFGSALSGNLIGALSDVVVKGQSVGQTIQNLAENFAAMIPGVGGVAKQVLGFMDSIGLGLGDLGRKLLNTFRKDRGADPVAEWYRDIERMISAMQRMGVTAEQMFLDLKIQFPDISDDLLRSMIEGTSNALADYQSWLGTYRPSGVGNSVKVLNEWLFEELEKGLSPEGAVASILSRAAAMDANAFQDLFGIRRDKWGKNDQYQGVFGGILKDLLDGMADFGVDFTKAITDVAVSVVDEIDEKFTKIEDSLADSLSKIQTRLDLGLISDEDLLRQQISAYERAINAMIDANLSVDDPRFIAIYDAYAKLNEEMRRTAEEVAPSVEEAVEEIGNAWDKIAATLQGKLSEIDLSPKFNFEGSDTDVAAQIEKVQAQMKAYTDAIAAAARQGLDSENEFVKELLASYNALGEELEKLRADALQLDISARFDAVTDSLDKLERKYKLLGDEQEYFAEKAKLLKKVISELATTEGIDPDDSRLLELSAQYQAAADAAKALADQQKQIDATVRGAVKDGNEAVLVTIAERAIDLWRTADTLIKQVSQDATAWMGQWQTDVIAGFASLLTSAREYRTQTFDDIKQALGGYSVALVSAFNEAFEKFETLTKMIHATIMSSDFGQIARSLMDETAPTMSRLISEWQSGIMSVFSAMDNLGRTSTTVFEGILNNAILFADKMTGAFQTAAQRIRDALSDFSDITATININQSAGTSMAGAAQMATGGIVPAGFPNDTYPALLSSGEMVIPSPHPLPNLGGGSQIIRIELDGRIITEAVVMHTPDVVRITTGGVY